MTRPSIPRRVDEIPDEYRLRTLHVPVTSGMLREINVAAASQAMTVKEFVTNVLERAIRGEKGSK